LPTSHAIVLKVVAVVVLATIVVRKDIASRIAPTLARSFVVTVMLRVMRVANAPSRVTTLVSSAPTAKKWDTQRSAARLPSRLTKRAVMQEATVEVMPQAMVELTLAMLEAMQTTLAAVVTPGVVARLLLLAVAGKFLAFLDATFCRVSSSWQKT
jgi:hypothetical protein